MGDDGLGVAVLVEGLIIGGLEAAVGAVVDRVRPSSLSRVCESVGRPIVDPADGRLLGTTLVDGLPIRDVSLRRSSVGSVRLGLLESKAFDLGAVGLVWPMLGDLVPSVRLGRLEPDPLRLPGSNLVWAVRGDLELRVLGPDRSAVGGLKLRPLTLGLVGDLELGTATLERLGALKAWLLPVPRLVAGARTDGEGALIDGEGALAAALGAERPRDGRLRDDSFSGFSAAAATVTANASPSDRHPNISRRTAVGLNALLLVLEASIVSLPDRGSASYGKCVFKRRAYRIVTICRRQAARRHKLLSASYLRDRRCVPGPSPAKMPASLSVVTTIL